MGHDTTTYTVKSTMFGRLLVTEYTPCDEGYRVTAVINQGQELRPLPRDLGVLSVQETLDRMEKFRKDVKMTVEQVTVC